MLNNTVMKIPVHTHRYNNIPWYVLRNPITHDACLMHYETPVMFRRDGNFYRVQEQFNERMLAYYRCFTGLKLTATNWYLMPMAYSVASA